MLTPPKTARSRRKIALTARAIKALREHRNRQDALRETAKEAWQETDFVFTDVGATKARGFSRGMHGLFP